MLLIIYLCIGGKHDHIGKLSCGTLGLYLYYTGKRPMFEYATILGENTCILHQNNGSLHVHQIAKNWYGWHMVNEWFFTSQYVKIHNSGSHSVPAFGLKCQ